jgi:fructokinase
VRDLLSAAAAAGGRIVVAGEALCDVFPGEDTPQGLSLDARIGGSPLNVAIGLARLGLAVDFLGAVSSDRFGRRIVDALHAEGVGTGLLSRVEAPTTLSIVDVDAEGRPAYAFHGERGADRQLHADRLPALPPDTVALQVGSYAMVVEPVATALRRLAARERGRRLVAWDLNLRMRVEPDRGRWLDTLEGMVACTDLLKLSDEDFDGLFPGERTDERAAQWLAAGVGCVVVTRGAAGATAYAACGRIDVAGTPVSVVDTVGAGDTFQAALLAALAGLGRLEGAALRGIGRDALAQVLGFAARAAGVTCTRRVADLPSCHELASVTPEGEATEGPR